MLDAGTNAEETNDVKLEGEAATKKATVEEPKAEGEEKKDDAPKKPEEKTPFQKRIDALTAEKRRLEAEKDMLLKALSKNEPVKEKEEEEPKEFKTVEEYIDHQVSKKLKEGMKAVEATTAQTKVEAIQEIKVKEFNERAEAFAEKNPDFFEAINDPSIPSSPSIAQALIEADNGPDVAYYLAKNQTEYMKILNLSPIQQVVAIGKLAAKLEGTTTKTPVSSAPDPLKPLKGGNASVSSEPTDKDDIETWMRKERARMLAKAGKK